MWLSFEEYSGFGGTASENDFASLEFKARKRIDYRTFERISTPSDDVKRLVFELIEMQRSYDERDPSVSGFGNDGVSVSFVSPDAAKADFESRANELIDTVCGDLVYRGLG